MSSSELCRPISFTVLYCSLFLVSDWHISQERPDSVGRTDGGIR